ncbi:hypothetical protein D1816_17900 [Aquimarina sp. AD10]|uniref:hypothetical protein n=1 Tax=Aquimarina sp. AD10 TaxID=1714849 RepID=UPI000E535260|nr:hypothetical protein [Aquimarina sp. AD10]AXT62151.1 hypothetical protein D1816_17900 [Aquimarina sp. AD10]RKM90654.1 hypothetical protein D7033_24480 [Aquimarina sp. AD10]
MKNDKKILHEIVKHFDEMNKIEAYDIIHKLETLLFYADNPLNLDNLIHIINSDIDSDHEIDPFHFTILPNGNFCEFIGHNNWIHIYKENKKIMPEWLLFDTYYYKTKYAPLELRKLTRKNLLTDIKDKPEERKVRTFLKKKRLSKKDIITNKLLILDDQL